MSNPNRYQAIIAKIFSNHFKNSDEFEFDREELVSVAKELKINLPKKLGDLIYSFRYRNEAASISAKELRLYATFPE